MWSSWDGVGGWGAGPPLSFAAKGFPCPRDPWMADGEGTERGAGCCGGAVPFFVPNSSVEPRFLLRNVLRALGALLVPLTLSQQRSRGFCQYPNQDFPSLCLYCRSHLQLWFESLCLKNIMYSRESALLGPIPGGKSRVLLNSGEAGLWDTRGFVI